MARAELGSKRTDPETGKKFYDLGKDPIVSPYTGMSYPLSFFEQAAQAPSRRTTKADLPVHREEGQGERAEEQDEEETDTVSLSDLEEEEDAPRRDDADVDVGDDDDEKDDDTFLTLDEEDGDENVDDLVGDRDEDDA